MRVCRRIVVDVSHLDPCAFRQVDGRSVAILTLPVEVPIPDPNERLRFPIRKSRIHLHLSTQQVRVRCNSNQIHVFRHREPVGYFLMGTTGSQVNLVSTRNQVGQTSFGCIAERKSD